MDVQELERRKVAHGFSLVGLLMVIVALGALTATAVVGVSTLSGSSNGIGTSGRGSPAAEAAAAAGVAAAGAAAAKAVPGGGSSGSARRSCRASADAARSASTLYFANSGGGSYPVKWSDMTTSNHPIYKLETNVVINSGNPKELDGAGWRLIVSGGGVSAPTFTCR
jgi:hypothetical protein